MRLLVVDERSETQRLDNFLSRECRGVPRSHLYRVIRAGQVRINGKRAKADSRLVLGDTVRIPPLRTERGPQRPAPGGQWGRRGAALPVIYEDESLLVIDKPAGIAVHGGSGVDAGAVELLRAARSELGYLELVHRLDRDTSGVLLLAKRRAALVNLHAQLRERVADKRYLALVSGEFPRRERKLDACLRRYLNQDGERRVAVDPQGGQSALTHVLGSARASHAGLGCFSRVLCKLETGRTHQIRVHLADDGYAIAGDSKYGDYALNRLLARAGFDRMFLHAMSMVLRHPDSGRTLRLQAQVPEIFDRLVPPDDSTANRANSVL